MLITLKESEIATAVKRYLTTQGINLTGKSVNIEFTATRSNGGGIRADVAIDELDSDIPGFSDADTETGGEAVKTVLAVVPPTTPVVVDTAAAAPVKTVKEIAAAAAAVVLEEDKPAETPVEAPMVKPTTSLFGS